MSRGEYPLHQGAGSKLSGRLCPLDSVGGMVVVYAPFNLGSLQVLDVHPIIILICFHENCQGLPTGRPAGQLHAGTVKDDVGVFGNKYCT